MMQTAITATMSVAEVLDRCPEAAQILLEAGMSCVACSIASMESLEEGARLHNLDLPALLERLNAACKQLPETEAHQ